MLIKQKDRIIVPKGWGWEDWIYNGEKYCGKRLFFHQYKECSWHYHVIKDEVLYLQSGKIVLHYSNMDELCVSAKITLYPNDAFHILPEIRHKMYAEEESVIIEFSTHHEDSDSYRIFKGD